MRKLVVLLILTGAIIAAWQLKSEPTTETPTSSNSPSSNFNNFVSIPYNDEVLNMAWFETDAKNISLIPNFNDRKIASEIIEEFKCKNLINGGFYSKEGSPIGLFVTDEKTVGNLQQNQLFNGFIKITPNDNFTISTDASTQNAKIALQTGPILYKNGSPIRLSIRNDEFARRMTAATSGNKVIFIAAYQKDSVYLGPKLADLPGLIGEFENKTQINIKDAINLDGGSASAFYTQGLFLPEITPVGSFFCITN